MQNFSKVNRQKDIDGIPLINGDRHRPADYLVDMLGIEGEIGNLLELFTNAPGVISGLVPIKGDPTFSITIPVGSLVLKADAFTLALHGHDGLPISPSAAIPEKYLVVSVADPIVVDVSGATVDGTYYIKGSLNYANVLSRAYAYDPAVSYAVLQKNDLAVVMNTTPVAGNGILLGTAVRAGGVWTLDTTPDGVKRITDLGVKLPNNRLVLPTDTLVAGSDNTRKSTITFSHTVPRTVTVPDKTFTVADNADVVSLQNNTQQLSDDITTLQAKTQHLLDDGTLLQVNSALQVNGGLIFNGVFPQFSGAEDVELNGVTYYSRVLYTKNLTVIATTTLYCETLYVDGNLTIDPGVSLKLEGLTTRPGGSKLAMGGFGGGDGDCSDGGFGGGGGGFGSSGGHDFAGVRGGAHGGGACGGNGGNGGVGDASGSGGGGGLGGNGGHAANSTNGGLSRPVCFIIVSGTVTIGGSGAIYCGESSPAATYGDVGGAGGGGGGAIVLVAFGGFTNYGTLYAKGGNGANGLAGTGATGGGGGGGGGFIEAYAPSTPTPVWGTFDVSGGYGGSGANTGSAGAAGASGTYIRVLLDNRNILGGARSTNIVTSIGLRNGLSAQSAAGYLFKFRHGLR